MVNDKRRKLTRDEIRRIKFLKNELLVTILKSILHNTQIAPKYRAYAVYKLQRKNTFYTQQKNFCLITGRGRGVWKFCNLSRHIINNHAKLGTLVNIKVNNEK